MASQYVKLPVSGGGGGPGAGVDSFNGRTGPVLSQIGDYSASIVSNTPSGSISSTTVQGAINELDGDVSSLSSSLSALTTTVAGKQNADADLTAIANLTGTGIIARTGAGTANLRTISGGANISVTNGDGVSGNPTVALSGVVPIANGGTNLSSTPAAGQLLIGTGSGFALAQLTAGANVNISNAAGAITISATGGGSPSFNLEGGNASSVYGGTNPIDGGTA